MVLYTEPLGLGELSLIVALGVPAVPAIDSSSSYPKPYSPGHTWTLKNLLSVLLSMISLHKSLKQVGSLGLREASSPKPQTLKP